mmetsp:Transcript_2349/g.7029  ORF Transcript_2349/g.7029 Transcript_2349/m.7029 type:complete len:190 (-) Transcript_2349:1308-1877(-)|eukprot:CAMPEP_0206138014 /NCGR_PEP_ID=MMETSP1473-20131121/3010_1 /ASSEMBLY_ACC=CAM_ASM_001109 /TAXON_ID=1461547 /ORGANISM="Stichococcus sp, Strain RCC1054" /LENGTH=189 /DNA_ID=CAMNT_0053531315 /DNA_START=293 /DNA_END=862 /DNA_ORIENTATION=+
MAETFLERELRIRRKVESVFNREEVDFASADEYNDYLEQKEDIIFNLTERIDVEATAARLAKYERDNADSILAVNLRQAETIREADEAAVARGMDLDGEETSSAIKAADATEHAEGHGAVQYAAAAPTMLDTRAAPVLVKEAIAGNQVYAPQDPLLTDRQRHELMAKASGWHPGITAARAMQQALSTFA